MKHTGLIILLSFLTAGCSIFNTTNPSNPVVLPDNSKVISTLNDITSNMLNAEWLSGFLMKNNERPVLMPLIFGNNTDADFDTERLLKQLEESLISSGKVRVIKSTPTQKKLTPNEILSGISIDFVVTVTLDKNTQADNTYMLTILLWGRGSNNPEIKIQKIIQ
ncbi:MAG: hypothetical protein JW798_02350 [Prolixibacteraceae bacterium]|nr:hypothetical protein [Prolixibacteraceae bacterium]